MRLCSAQNQMLPYLNELANRLPGRRCAFFFQIEKITMSSAAFMLGGPAFCFSFFSRLLFAMWRFIYKKE
jgi:hypothetical protein